MPRRGEPEDRHPVAVAFGNAVRAAREAREETLETVAGRIERVDVTNGKRTIMDLRTLGEIERGWHSPTVVTAKQIADALEIPLSDLVTDL